MSGITKGTIVYQSKGSQKIFRFEFGKNLGSDDIEVFFSGKKLADGYNVRIFIIPKKVIQIIDAYLEYPITLESDDRFMINGYQSWTTSGEFSLNESYEGLRKLCNPVISHYKLANYGDSTFYKYRSGKGNFHSYTFTFIRKNNGNYIRFLGSLSEENGFTIFESYFRKKLIKIRKECEKLIIKEKTELFNLLEYSGDENSVFKVFAQMKNITPPEKISYTGWTSWYNYYEKITEEIILENLRHFSEQNIPIDIFQIDDGYQLAVGDWLETNSKFPNGMRPIVESIKQAGFIPGLWLAPFICEQSSRIFAQHPEWIVRDESENFIPIGYNPFNWSGNYYALDIYHPQVRSYLKEVFDTVLNHWGFEMVKLDFLHAACFTPRNGKPRGKIICDAMEFLRDCVSDKKILGCGLPLAAGFGIVDFCRIGSDVSLGWEDKRLSMIRYRERVSTYNSLTSTIGRRNLNGRFFINDPDVFFLRSDNIHMNENQKFSLYVLNLIFGGLVFTSDNISKYDKSQMSLYRSHFPHRPKQNLSVTQENNVKIIRFQIGKFNYVVYSNLNSKEENVSHNYGLWYETHHGLIAGQGSLTLFPFQTRIFLEVSHHPFTFAGTSGHIFPGSEITHFEFSDNSMKIETYPNGISSNEILIIVPEHSEGLMVNEELKKSETWKDIHLIRYTLQK